ncbi:hypothetical protein [Frondihabitans australicus]|uniref:Uncharacterized protein n=1 Tax=Frondihabitans australicus TaxID=386892 RepID=A0A495IG67_9MICO|nr:hypothetical protein [Frondihabitans australicus]RKR74398.1 hypothetical protein C8E83_1510 [Frondihabitans australicus]
MPSGKRRSPARRRRPSAARRRSRRAAPGVASRLTGFGIAIGAGAVVTLLVALVVAVAGSGIGHGLGALAAGSGTSSSSETSIAVSCPAAKPVQIGTVLVPAGPVDGYCQDRLINAAHIINAARAQGIGTRTQEVGVMTAMGESSLVNIDHGDVAGPDSRGLFQQRDNGAWGSYSDRMTPYIAATHFFDKLIRVPGWQTMQPSLLAHTVQVNSDPNHYASYWPAAVAVVQALTGQSVAS